MASGDDSVPIWPGPVTFDDDVPKRGFARILLTVPNLTVKRKNILGKNRPRDANVDSSFDDGVIRVKVTLTGTDKESVYEYKKNAPEDIDSKRCEIIYQGNYVGIKLAKVRPDSWASHSRYLIEKPAQP